MRLPDIEHTARPWRIHEITPDFRLEDVWAFRTPGAGPNDFPAVLAALRAAGGLNQNPAVVRFLFAVRWKLGALFGWDKPDQGLGGRVESLVDRLPHDLRQDTAGAAVPNTPFTMMYELHEECAIEKANKTVQGICHLGWVPTGDGEYELRMAALVKTNGLFGRLYMAAIKPFRYLIVYPALTRKWERAWQDRERYLGTGARTTAGPVGPDTPTDPWSRRWPPSGQPRRGRGVRPRDENTELSRAAPQQEWRVQMIKWAGRLIVFYGTAHTIGALTAEGAARHAGAWFSGELWGEDLANMSPAMSAYWLSVNSFGPPLILIGLLVLWLDRRGITPPPFIAWSLGAWVVVGTVVAGPGIGQDLILLVASGLLLAGARRAKHATTPSPTPSSATPISEGSARLRAP
jgi:hypothetical protein